MKTLTVRLPAALVADLETESRARHRSRSDIVRERLSLAARSRLPAAPTDTIADLVGSVDGLPAHLSGRRKAFSGRRGMAASVLVDACLVRMSETVVPCMTPR